MDPARNLLCLLVLLALAGTIGVSALPQGNQQGDPRITLEQVTAAAKLYFRDIAELPMTVQVTTTVADSSGKTKKKSSGSIQFLFHGYNPGTEKGTFTVHYGMFHKKRYEESLNGNLAVIFAGMYLRPELIGKQSSPSEIRPPEGPGQPWIFRFSTGPDCPAFKLSTLGIAPESMCGIGEYRISLSEAGELSFEYFVFEQAGLPAEAPLEGLGIVNILAFHTEEEFQRVSIAGDARPFLLPRRTTTSIATHKGKVVITNEYAVAEARKQKN
ncbi:MAG TPA: hypothetical protein VEH49_10785 [Methylomirabilota bacterium]|nr:hypothetical protein [Methylomirabilota bacterium]